MLKYAKIMRFYSYFLHFSKLQVNVSFFRKFNGFRPFMFNATFDFCKFMSKTNNEMSFAKIIISNFLVENSNINQSCPYEVN